MDLLVSDTNILTKFTADFVKVIDKLNIKYAIVSGFVVIAHGRSRGTEDIDLIIERLSKEQFYKLHNELEKNEFECLQGNNVENLYVDYLIDNLSLRYVRKNEFLPEMELKLSKDKLDEYQLKTRTKLKLTNLNFYFSTIEMNIAFKEELLKSGKDLADAKHLRIIYENKLNKKEIENIKKMINEYRL
ncbi:MAG: hypothetical protein WC915_02700 [archaeon]|jgi:hypothetical protein